MSETYEQQMKDSDTIFTAVSTANYNNVDAANRAVVLFYVPDLSFSRAGISHALKRLDKLFDNRRTAKCWYLYEEDYCPVCGRTYSKSRTRQYTEKPKNRQDRYLRTEIYDLCED